MFYSKKLKFGCVLYVRDMCVTCLEIARECVSMEAEDQRAQQHRYIVQILHFCGRSMFGPKASDAVGGGVGFPNLSGMSQSSSVSICLLGSTIYFSCFILCCFFFTKPARLI